MRNIKLTIQYDGTAYHGWQSQKNAVTVQEVLEKAIFTKLYRYVWHATLNRPL